MSRARRNRVADSARVIIGAVQIDYEWAEYVGMRNVMENAKSKMQKRRRRLKSVLNKRGDAYKTGSWLRTSPSRAAPTLFISLVESWALRIEMSTQQSTLVSTNV